LEKISRTNRNFWEGEGASQRGLVGKTRVSSATIEQIIERQQSKGIGSVEGGKRKLALKGLER